MFEFEHAGEVIDTMLNLMLINHERDRAALLREKNALRTHEEDLLDRERRRHKYERAKLQKERARSLSREHRSKSTALQKERAMSLNHEHRSKSTAQQNPTRRAASQPRVPTTMPLNAPKGPLPSIPRHQQPNHQTTHRPTPRTEELITLSQPRDERFIQQTPAGGTAKTKKSKR
ncbi:hypothetical protein CLAFUW4_04069 [Fulvia fulva]|uniref:Uncharacterized protein n=1 Tax=Passalora fulva TaxID=5499 RepID=A0A9Q8LFR6_PASFU|nr:uncharacterized protein CLAFUR5_04032 [Fulvia fulva]KAK4626514.1 hypothetical protein CLAFUR4_04055 [Fulvia fulva]KAK4628211.1 hypothetical protein CLAFUR0_04056 [Fulvia fulva]UJO16601.1 hypothetical protein CLAFUR5_04032 [Fulvia fulva]WPV13906.1 hypothetical protein CLAFUW4_04069 [Fulvia fulva]WPV29178.1 hypothetical protein CLAFUW7_04058 [Fulvia fulva]